MYFSRIFNEVWLTVQPSSCLFSESQFAEHVVMAMKVSAAAHAHAPTQTQRAIDYVYWYI
jgi:hypothetical protein